MSIFEIKKLLIGKGFNLGSLSDDELLLLNKCLDVDSLKNAYLSEGYFYNSIALCLVDAVFSIGARYDSVCRPTVQRFANEVHIDPLYHAQNENPSDEYKLENLIGDVLNLGGTDYGATSLYHCQRPTSNSPNRKLRSEVIFQIACFLRGLGINSIADFRDVLLNDPDKMNLIEQSWTGRMFSGQTEVSYTYFIMLVGEDNMMKVDRWIIRFLEGALNRNVNISHETIRTMYANVLEVLKQKPEYANLTLRLFDHTIWKYSKNEL